jgi:plastocyanin
MKIFKAGAVSILTVFLVFSVFRSSFAQDEVYTITIKDHQFTPAELIIPANKKVKIVIDNQDITAEEFESFELHREKVVNGHAKITVFVGPLKPGRYKYFGEFHQDTAQGIIVAQ